MYVELVFIEMKNHGGKSNMLLTGYRKKLSRAKCDPSFQSLRCTAYLNEDISEVLPYLNG